MNMKHELPIEKDVHGDADFERNMAFEHELLRSRVLAAGLDAVQTATRLRRAVSELALRIEDVRRRTQRLIKGRVHKILGSDAESRSSHVLADVMKEPVMRGEFEVLWNQSAERGADAVHGARLGVAIPYGKHRTDL